MLCAASVSTWAYKSNPHISEQKVGVYKQLTIHVCDNFERVGNHWVRVDCDHSLKEIIDAAQITEDDKIDLITVKLDNKLNKVVEGFPYQ